MSKTNEKKINPTLERDNRVKPAVREIFHKLGEEANNLSFGSHGVTSDGMNDHYSQFVSTHILPIVFNPKHDLKVGDITYLFSLLHQVTGFVQGKVDQTMQHHYDMATAKLYGRESVDEVSVQDINKVILESQGKKLVDNSIDQKDKGK